MIIKLIFVKLVKKEFVLQKEMMDMIKEKNMGINDFNNIFYFIQFIIYPPPKRI